VPSHLLHAGSLHGPFLALKLEAIRFFEISVLIRTTLRYIPEEGNIQVQELMVDMRRWENNFKIDLK
jgi:hypothetical protein